MSFAVKLYTLSKRDNSTKRPAANAGTTFNCILKSGSGIMRPTLSFDIGVTNDPSQYNYAYIAAFDRYYFIEEWYFEQALWTATLKIDVLATYKTEIGNSRLYVMRAAGAHNGNIIDNLYPTKTGCSYAHDTISNPWDSSMCFVIGCVSKNANFGSLAYYAVTVAGLSSICTNLLDPTTGAVTEDNGFSWDDCSQALQLSLVDPLQYIKSCVALPVGIGDITGSDTGVIVYNWSAGVGGKRLYLNPYVTKTYSFSIQKHPDTNSRGNYVNSAPYTSITLTIPPFGSFDIDTSVTCNASTITATVKLDPITGQASLTITCNGIVLNRVVSQLGIPISLSSVTRDYVGAASAAAGAIGGIASAFMGNPVGILGSVNGIGNAINGMMPRASTVGSTGSFATNQGDFRLDHQFFRPVDDDNTHNGRPLCEMRTINTLSGYMIIQDGDVAINGTSAEDQSVRNYLESGFYYE